MTTAASSPQPPGGSTRIGFAEFVVLVAAMMASQALAIDAMLPALPTIVRELHVGNPNHGQWVVTAYVVGLALGQLFWGMISDRFGRRPILLVGLGLYALAAISCGLSQSFTALLTWRLVHGLAASSVVVARSVIRDLYSGRHMARVMSLTFIVFLLSPIVAPSIGQLILLTAPWRDIFIVCGVYALIVWTWTLLRLPETLHPEYRMTLTGAHIAGAVRLILGNRISLGYTCAMTVLLGSLLAYVGMAQQIFGGVFHRPAQMPTMFALCAAAMGVASFLNSRIVERVGMRRISHTALLVFILVTLLHVLIAGSGLERLWSFLVLQSITMASFSLALPNFGAMAMEPVGSVAGIGASLQGFISTFGGALVAAGIGSLFNGSTLPLAAGALCCGLAALLCVLLAEQGRLFRTHPAIVEPGAAGEMAI
jgi:DHA1 family bicyclomycin/chloramphenicol resistance-like MFS transporter